MSWVELVGYAASALIVVSLALSSTVWLRGVNLLGCLCFVVYGWVIGAWPVAVANAIICGLDVWYLAQHYRTRNDVGAVPIAGDAPYLHDFLAARAHDIARFQPTFTGATAASDAWLLTRDGLPVGALVGRRDGETLSIELDYVTPPFRDARVGQWVHGDGAGVFRSAGIRRLVSDPGAPRHRDYLHRVGFHVDGSEMVKDL